MRKPKTVATVLDLQLAEFRYFTPKATLDRTMIVRIYPVTTFTMIKVDERMVDKKQIIIQSPDIFHKVFEKGDNLKI